MKEALSPDLLFSCSAFEKTRRDTLWYRAASFSVRFAFCSALMLHRSPAACMMASTVSSGWLPQVMAVSPHPALSIMAWASSVSSF